MSESDDKFWEILSENEMIGGADMDNHPTLHPAANQKITDEVIVKYLEEKMDIYNEWQMEVSDLPDDWGIVDFFEGEDE